MRGADAGPEDCVCCLEPLAGNRVVRWPQCGGVTHRFHALCATAYQPMRRALSHLRVTGDSARVARVPCILCRSPWGSGPESVSELQHLCASLQDSGLPHGDCDCAACCADRDARRHSDMETDAPQPFMHLYGTDRAAEARAAFNELVVRARLAGDAQAVVSAYTWSAMLVPFIWSAAADEDHAEWPSVTADLCSGLSMGADSVRTCWVQLRAAFRTAGVDCMQDLCDHISRSEAAILAWASRGSRHSSLTPSAIQSRLVGLARGAYLDNTSSKSGCSTVRKKPRVCPSLRLWEPTCIARRWQPHGWGWQVPHTHNLWWQPSNLKLKRSQPGNGVDEVTLASLAACMVTSPTLVDGRQCKQCATTWRHTALANTRERFHKIGCCHIALRLVVIAIVWCREVQGRCTDLAGLRLVQRVLRLWGSVLAAAKELRTSRQFLRPTGRPSSTSLPSARLSGALF